MRDSDLENLNNQELNELLAMLEGIDDIAKEMEGENNDKENK